MACGELTWLVNSTGFALNQAASPAAAAASIYFRTVFASEFKQAIPVTSPWWPRRSGFVGDLAVDIGVLDSLKSYEDIDLVAAGDPEGALSKYAYVGITRDEFGSPLGACTVRLYRTLTGEFIEQTVSDASGNYTVYTPFFETHFVTMHKGGTPNRAGATIDTIVGT